MTAINDRSPTRPTGGDLFFAKAKDASPVKPPPIVKMNRVYVPLELVVILVVVGVLVWRAVRRRPKA
jgi:hypothetical protein